MSQFEYKVIPTPRRPKRAKGVKGEPARFANALTDAINEIAVDGWEFYKTETLPMDAKPGLFSKRIETFQSVMVFRKALVEKGLEPLDTLTATPPPIPMVADMATDTPPLTAVEDEPDTKFEFSADNSEDAPAPADAEGSNDDVTFDSENMDPLKFAVEANRRPDPSE